MSQATIQTDLDNIASQQVRWRAVQQPALRDLLQPGTYGSAADRWYSRSVTTPRWPAWVRCRRTRSSTAQSTCSQPVHGRTSDCNSDDILALTVQRGLNVDLRARPGLPPRCLIPTARAANSAEIWSASQALRSGAPSSTATSSSGLLRKQQLSPAALRRRQQDQRALDFYGNQQYMVRNSDIGGANGCPQGLWNMVYSASRRAVAGLHRSVRAEHGPGASR